MNALFVSLGILLCTDPIAQTWSHLVPEISLNTSFGSEEPYEDASGLSPQEWEFRLDWDLSFLFEGEEEDCYVE